jgi:hypothetical protein
MNVRKKSRASQSLPNRQVHRHKNHRTDQLHATREHTTPKQILQLVPIGKCEGCCDHIGIIDLILTSIFSLEYPKSWESYLNQQFLFPTKEQCCNAFFLQEGRSCSIFDACSNTTITIDPPTQSPSNKPTSFPTAPRPSKPPTKSVRIKVDAMSSVILHFN